MNPVWKFVLVLMGIVFVIGLFIGVFVGPREGGGFIGKGVVYLIIFGLVGSLIYKLVNRD